MYYTVIIKPDINIRNKITYIKNKLEKKYGYTGTLSNKGVHITLLYLKNYNKLCVDKIIKVCNETKELTMKIDSINYFERIKNDKKYYIVYINVIPSEELKIFHDKLSLELKENVFINDKFIPHFSLVRKNVDDNRLNDIINDLKDFNIDKDVIINHILIGKRSDMDKRWNFKRIYFNKI